MECWGEKEDTGKDKIDGVRYMAGESGASREVVK